MPRAWKPMRKDLAPVPCCPLAQYSGDKRAESAPKAQGDCPISGVSTPPNDRGEEAGNSAQDAHKDRFSPP